MSDYRKAKGLYFAFGGSVFYMSRNGFDGEYGRYQVPAEVESEWRADLLAIGLVHQRTQDWDRTSDDRKARALYFAFRGFVSNMSRYGFDGEYRSYEVPPELEQEWEADLVARYLAHLRTQGARAEFLSFFVDKRYPQYLPDVLDADIELYTLAEICAYLETLVAYIDICVPHHDQSTITAALELVITQANAAMRKAQAVRSRARIQSLIDGAVARMPA